MTSNERAIEGRIVALDSGASILFDPIVAAQAQSNWFDPDYWRRAGVLREVQGGRGSVHFVAAPFGDVVLRHYRRGGLIAHFNRDRYLWTGAESTRAFREWRLLARLRALALPVPVPVAARYTRRGFSYRADLITREVSGAQTLAARLIGAQTAAADWSAVGRVIAEFHGHGAYHADLNAHNVLFDKTGAVWVVDFDRGEIRDPGVRRWQAENLERLHRSLVKVGAREKNDPIEVGWRSLLTAYQQTRAS